LQEQEDVLVVLPLLVRFWVKAFGEDLETSDLLVERREVLLDDKGQLLSSQHGFPDIQHPVHTRCPPHLMVAICASMSVPR